ncbi:MAG: DUF6325 family protein [Thermoleophilia bacterium]
MLHGPVDVIVLTFDEPRFDGSVTLKLAELAQQGIIRVLDAAVVSMSEGGVRTSLDIEDLPADEAALLGFIDTGSRGLFDADDVQAMFEGLAPGTAAAALAIEHRWAIGLEEAVHNVGGELALEMRVPAAVVNEAFAALANPAE